MKNEYELEINSFGTSYWSPHCGDWRHATDLDLKMTDDEVSMLRELIAADVLLELPDGTFKFTEKGKQIKSELIADYPEAYPQLFDDVVKEGFDLIKDDEH